MKLRRLAPSPVISAPVAGSTSHRFWTTALVLALLLLFASALAVYLERGGSSGGTHEALSEDERWALAATYSPVLRFSIDERTFPTDVGYFIERSHLIDRSRAIIAEHPSSDDLSLAGQGMYLDNYLGSGDDLGVITAYENDISIVQSTVYIRIVEGDGRVALQYWMFYIFNLGTFNSHEGDWEMVQVVLDREDLSLHSVVLSQHHGYGQVDWAKGVEAENGTHPVVIVSCGSHANYFPGTMNILAGDIIDGSGERWEPQDYVLIPIGEEWSGHVPEWLLFQGHWGEPGGIWAGILGTEGPRGPMYREDGLMWDALSWGS